MLILICAISLWQGESDDLRTLVGRLREADIRVREEASFKLLSIGAAAVPALDQAACDTDSEVAARAAEIARRIRLRTRLGPRLIRHFPSLEAELFQGSAHSWTQALLTVAHDDTCDVTTADAEALFPEALVGVETKSERIAVARFSGNWAVRSAASRIARLLATQEPEVKCAVLESLAVIGGVNELDAILTTIGDRESQVRQWACETLCVLGERSRSVEALQPLLRDRSNEVRRTAVFAIGRLSEKDQDVSEMADLLQDPCSLVRKAAIESLGLIGNAASYVEPLLTDDASEIRAAAANALCLAGRMEGARRLLIEAQRQEVPLLALNVVYRSQRWSDVKRRSILASPRATRRQLLLAVARVLGCEVEVEGTAREWLDASGPAVNVVNQTPADIILDRLSGSHEFILEEETLRVLPWPKAREYWQKVASGK